MQLWGETAEILPRRCGFQSSGCDRRGSFKKREKILFADMALALIFTHPHIIFLL